MVTQKGNTEFVPAISVILISESGNPEAVEKTLNSIISQNGGFVLQINIILKGYDANVADLCQTYKAMYPDKIRFYSGTTAGEPDEITISGEYIMVCRDFEVFTDSSKLNIQCGFLTSHPQFSVCFHNVTGSGAALIAEGDYPAGCLSLQQIIKLYSPLIRVNADNRRKFKTALFKKGGEATLARDAYRGLMRCLKGVDSYMNFTRRHATLLKNKENRDIFEPVKNRMILLLPK